MFRTGKKIPGTDIVIQLQGGHISGETSQEGIHFADKVKVLIDGRIVHTLGSILQVETRVDRRKKPYVPDLSMIGAIRTNRHLLNGCDVESALKTLRAVMLRHIPKILQHFYKP